MAGLKNILIGVFVLIAFTIIVFILLFLHPTVGDSGKTLFVRFTDIDKVNIGTRVTYAGLAVGEVVNIEEIPDARTNRLDYNGDVYVYQLTLRIDSSVKIYSTDTIAVRTSGLLGERNIEINPQPLKPGQELFLIENEIIYAEPTPSVEDTLKAFGALSKKFETVLDGVNDVIDEIKKEKVVEKIAKTAQNAVEITNTFNQPEKWNKIIDNVWTLSERAKSSWDTIDRSLNNFYSLTERAHDTWTTIDHAMHKVDTLTERAHRSWYSVDDSLKEFRLAAVNTREFTNQIKEVIANTAQGQGTIGQLFASDDMYLRFKSIMHKGETIMNDINRFGLLYQNNKKWQRLNARRLNLIDKLSSPEQFTNYFYQELDRISISLSQVSMVLEDTNCYPYGFCNPEFSQKFANLLRKVEDVEESLKMYNEQVVDYCEQQMPCN